MIVVVFQNASLQTTVSSRNQSSLSINSARCLQRVRSRRRSKRGWHDHANYNVVPNMTKYPNTVCDATHCQECGDYSQRLHCIYTSYSTHGKVFTRREEHIPTQYVFLSWSVQVRISTSDHTQTCSPHFCSRRQPRTCSHSPETCIPR